MSEEQLIWLEDSRKFGLGQVEEICSKMFKGHKKQFENGLRALLVLRYLIYLIYLQDLVGASSSDCRFKNRPRVCMWMQLQLILEADIWILSGLLRSLSSGLPLLLAPLPALSALPFVIC